MAKIKQKKWRKGEEIGEILVIMLTIIFVGSIIKDAKKDIGALHPKLT